MYENKQYANVTEPFLNFDDEEEVQKDLRSRWRWNHNCVRLFRRNGQPKCTNIEVDQKSKLVVLSYACIRQICEMCEFSLVDGE